MLYVVATKLRARRPTGSREATAAGRVFEGYLLYTPEVGRGMVIFRGEGGRRMVTTPVRRVLKSPGRGVIYVETDNSVYRLAVDDGRLAAVG